MPPALFVTPQQLGAAAPLAGDNVVPIGQGANSLRKTTLAAIRAFVLAGMAAPADGVDGRTLLNGTGEPVDALGSDGDFYVDQTDESAPVFYGPKADGAWPAGVTLLTVAVLEAQKGAPGGIAELDENSKLPASRLPASIVGAVKYQGTWNADANTPAIPAAASGNKGWYYKVAVAGATAVDGIAEWKVGDWIISNGAAWEKIDNTDQVVSVAGKQGVVVLVKADVGLGNVDNTADAAKPVSTAQLARFTRLNLSAPGLKIGSAGDSIIAGSGYGLAVQRVGLRSQRHQMTPCRAVGGHRTDQIAGQLAAVIADGATACIVNGGANDFAQNVPVATVRANLIANWNTLLAAGVLPIDFGMLPRDGVGGAPTAESLRLAYADNELWRQNYCRINGIPHVNAWPKVANPDGTWLAGMGDGVVHPRSPAWDLIADKVIERLDDPAGVPRLLELVDRANGINGTNVLKNTVSFGGVQANVAVTAATLRLADGVTDMRWYPIGSAGSPSYSVRAPDAGDFGNWLRCTFGAASGGSYVGLSSAGNSAAALGWNAGDRIVGGMRLRSFTDAPTNLILRAHINASANLFMLYDDHAGGAGVDYYIPIDFTVPLSTTGISIGVSAAAGSAGSYFEINRPVLYNLTQNGLA